MSRRRTMTIPHAPSFTESVKLYTQSQSLYVLRSLNLSGILFLVARLGRPVGGAGAGEGTLFLLGVTIAGVTSSNSV